MKLLEGSILKDGNVLGENILKVDSFLTHQVDFKLMKEIGQTRGYFFGSDVVKFQLEKWLYKEAGYPITRAELQVTAKSVLNTILRLSY